MDPWMDAAHRGATALAEMSHDPVQHREGTNIEDPTSVHRAADAGVNGTGGTLPYFDQIQQSFGATHDLNSVRAHLGSAATQANERMGAQAYATGQNIALRMTAAEQSLVGHALDERRVTEAARAAADVIEEPLSDVHATAEFRRSLAASLGKRALT